MTKRKKRPAGIKPGERRGDAGGRPLLDAGDRREERFGFRLHANLYDEMARCARLEGLQLSIWVERACIDRVHAQTGRKVIDAIGRYLDPAMDRRVLQEAIRRREERRHTYGFRTGLIEPPKRRR